MSDRDSIMDKLVSRSIVLMLMHKNQLCVKVSKMKC